MPINGWGKYLSFMDEAGGVNRKFIKAGEIYGACWELYRSSGFYEAEVMVLCGDKTLVGYIDSSAP
jgi:hypothetical protein